MSKKSTDQLSLFPISSAPESHVKTCLLPEKGRVWMENEQGSSSSLHELLRYSNLNGLSLKMYRASFHQMAEGILPESLENWGNAGICSPTGFLTLNISEWPKDAAVCSLSEVLETDVAPKYSLSPKACAGILWRAEKRGRTLPKALQDALEEVARMITKLKGDS